MCRDTDTMDHRIIKGKIHYVAHSNHNFNTGIIMMYLKCIDRCINVLINPYKCIRNLTFNLGNKTHTHKINNTDKKQQWPKYDQPPFWLFEVFFFSGIFPQYKSTGILTLLTNLTFNYYPHRPFTHHKCPVALGMLSLPLTCESQELPSILVLQAGKKTSYSMLTDQDPQVCKSGKKKSSFPFVFF